MSIPTISPLPTAPNRADSPSDFSAKADAYIAALQPWASQVNAIVSELNTNTIPNINTAASNAATRSANALARENKEFVDQSVLYLALGGLI